MTSEGAPAGMRPIGYAEGVRRGGILVSARSTMIGPRVRRRSCATTRRWISRARASLSRGGRSRFDPDSLTYGRQTEITRERPRQGGPETSGEARHQAFPARHFNTLHVARRRADGLE